MAKKVSLGIMEQSLMRQKTITKEETAKIKAHAGGRTGKGDLKGAGIHGGLYLDAGLYRNGAG